MDIVAFSETLFNPHDRTDAEDAGYMAYYHGAPRPAEREAARGWDEARGIDCFIKCLEGDHE